MKLSGESHFVHVTSRGGIDIHVARGKSASDVTLRIRDKPKTVLSRKPKAKATTPRKRKAKAKATAPRKRKAKPKTSLKRKRSSVSVVRTSKKPRIKPRPANLK